MIWLLTILKISATSPLHLRFQSQLIVNFFTKYQIGHVMDDTISIDNPPAFNAEDWIGKNKEVILLSHTLFVMPA